MGYCREQLQEELEEAEEALEAQRQMAQSYQTESQSLKRQLEEIWQFFKMETFYELI